MTIESLFDQTAPAREIIIVNDGSIDHSTQVIRRYGDRVRLIDQENQGAARARFNGVKHAEGDIIVFTDAGDFSTPDRLARFKSRLEVDKRLVACCARTFLKAEGRVSKDAPILNGGTTTHGLIEDPLLAMLGQSWPLAIGMNFAVRREIAIHSADVPAFYKAANDYALQIKTAAQGPFGFIDAPTLDYELTPGGISAANGLLRQNAYALIAAAEALSDISINRSKYLDAYRFRLNAEAGKILAELILQRQFQLGKAVFKEILMHADLARTIRQFWWHIDEQETLGRIATEGATARIIQFLRRFHKGN